MCIRDRDELRPIAVKLRGAPAGTATQIQPQHYTSSVIGRIHGAIVDATVGAIVEATIACSVYTRRLSRRSSRQSSPRQSPRVYTTGDRRGNEHLFNRATNWQLSPRRSPVVYTWGDCRLLESAPVQQSQHKQHH